MFYFQQGYCGPADYKYSILYKISIPGIENICQDQTFKLQTASLLCSLLNLVAQSLGQGKSLEKSSQKN